MKIWALQHTGAPFSTSWDNVKNNGLGNGQQKYQIIFFLDFDIIQRRKKICFTQLFQ